MATTTTAVRMDFNNGTTKWSKTLSGLDASTVSDTATAKTFATAYAPIVDGDLDAVYFTKTEPVDID